MSPALATLAYVLGILILFFLARDRDTTTSKALWIPVIWLFIGGSRNVSQWLDHQSPPLDPGRYLEGNELDRNVLTGLLLLGIVVLVRRRVRLSAIMRSNAPVFLFFAYCGVSLLWSDYPLVGFKRWIRGLGDLVMVLVVLTETDQAAGVRRFLTRAGWWLVPLSILMIRHYPDRGRIYDRWTGTVSWTGVGTDKNALGLITMVFGLVSVWHFLEAARRNAPAPRRTLAAHACFITIACWLLVSSDSATSLACFVLGTVAMLVASRSAVSRNQAPLHALVVIVVVTAASALLFNTGTLAVETLGRDTTLTGRTDIWRRALGMNNNPLLGAGYETFWLGDRLEQMIRAYAFAPNQAHNGYIEVFLNLGWVGVGLVTAVIVVGYRHAVAAVRRHAPAASLGLAYVLVAIIYNFTEGAIKMMHPVWIVFLLFTIVVPQRSLQEVARRRMGALYGNSHIRAPAP
jgi:exopolysaccharide production protein ExoQ